MRYATFYQLSWKKVTRHDLAWAHVALNLTLAFAASGLCTLSVAYALDQTVGGSFGSRLFFGLSAVINGLMAVTVGKRLLGAPTGKAGDEGPAGSAPPSSSAPSTKPPPPDAGRPVPVTRSPKHHLVAAKALPPDDKTHAYPKD